MRPPPGALYNSAVAQSEAARAAPPGPARTARLQAAARAYAVALAADPTPQALNNAGLVCHELFSAAASSSPARAALASGAVARFRAALRAYPHFDRAVYNLGTVLYAHATAAGGSGAGAPSPSSSTPDAAALATAAQCVALASALAPTAEVYRRSLAAVRHLLPLPHLRAGWLLVADGVENADSSSSLSSLPPPAERWRARWCVLDGGGLRVVSTGPEVKKGGSPAPPPSLVAAAGEEEGRRFDAHPPPPGLPLAALAGTQRVADVALPAGAAFWVPPAQAASPHAVLGTFFVAAEEADADGWVDACVVGGRVTAEALGGVLR